MPVRRLLLLTSAIVLVDTMFFAALTPLLPHYVDELGLGKAGAGVLQAMYPLGALVAGIPSAKATIALPGKAARSCLAAPGAIAFCRQSKRKRTFLLPLMRAASSAIATTAWRSLSTKILFAPDKRPR